jgi:tRNA pseudouridine38-40 synthase
VVQDTIKGITGERVTVVGSGRTDSGVHAEAQVANFKTKSKLPLKKLQMAINSRLPKDIVTTDIEEASPRFNAQKSAKSKLYRYTIVNSDFMDPLMRHFAAKCFYKLDINAMRRAAKHLTGRHDFKSFQATEEKERTSVRTVKSIRIEKKENVIRIYIEANGFLYNMARNIVGTLVDAGRGRFTVDDVKEILKKRNIKFSGPTMPAKGLCMVEVRY